MTVSVSWILALSLWTALTVSTSTSLKPSSTISSSKFTSLSSSHATSQTTTKSTLTYSGKVTVTSSSRTTSTTTKSSSGLSTRTTSSTSKRSTSSAHAASSTSSHVTSTSSAKTTLSTSTSSRKTSSTSALATPAKSSSTTSTRTSSGTSIRTTSSRSSTSASPTPVRNNGKRGAVYNNDTFTLPWSLSGQNSSVSWAYNWYSSGSSGSSKSETSNPALNYVPMLWSNAADLENVWFTNAQNAIDLGADSLLSFNEPDACYGGSACMSVNDSVAAYKTYMQPFAGKARLGAPAVTNVGLNWLDQFLGNCTTCTIDFVPVHWYSNVYAFGYLQNVIESTYNLTKAHYPGGRPIWVTEYGIGNDGTEYTEAQLESFMKQSMSWLDAVPWIERYAWFYDAPGYLINSNGSGLSATGQIYNSYKGSCPNWNNDAGTC